MMDRKILYADEGMIYTNGDTYGREIYLSENTNENDFYQITLSEYEEKCNADMEQMEVNN